MKEDVTFEVQGLLADAKAATGLSDFGDERILEGLDVLGKTMDANSVEIRGRRRQRRRLVNNLSTRLKLIEATKQNPDLLGRAIKPPMLLTGLPRSGTSALFNLLNADPRGRAFLNWESMHPDPLPDVGQGENDPRKDELEALYELGRQQNPEFMKVHEVGAEVPEECVLGHALAFEGVQMGYEIALEPYRSWFMQRDLKPMYEFQKDLLSVLDWRNPGERWLLKAPAHMWGLDPLFEVFPNTQLVWGHRHPLKVVPSICSMSVQLLQMNVGDTSHMDLHAFSHTIMDFYASSLERGLEQRKNLKDSQVVDYSFSEFNRSPLDTVNTIYSHFNIEMTDDARSAIDAHAQANPRGKHGSHQYSLEEHGLTEKVICDRFAFYIDDPRWQPLLA